MRIRTLFLLTSLTAVFGCPADDDDDTDATATDPTTTTVTTTASTTDTTTTASTTASTTDSTESGSESSTANPETGSESGSESGSTGVDTSGSESGGDSPECVNYCDLFQTNCDGGIGGSDPYADDAACLVACSMFSQAGLECRTGHLDGTLTGTPDPDAAYYMTHCPHGDVDGTDVCMD